MRKKAVLFIDTSDNQKTIAAIEFNGKKKELVQKTGSWTSQVLLPMIDKLLKKNKLSIADISEIKVNVGPGSFTGLRVGAVVANALGNLLHIPVNGKIGNIIEPNYR
ncbi:tRNA (adenosine(37)-N6)-threonylcarbamoyltransferase complex dimerization subunit type 1 TsaB [Candidatus Gottesmanbacteria bacterium]|nr:tRNA (adenosine(37)-N6)-threonylcarbamoyltransferase complex dimerization subunit type 1 TsaB [Candidatus Gottesmanbacteria bacterium]